MAVLPQVKLEFQAPVWHGGLTNIRSGRRPAPVVASATIAINHKPNTTQRLSINGPIGSQVSLKDQFMIDDERAFTRSDKEVGMVMERLERVVEGVRERELEKLKRREMRRGEISNEERMMVEVMSREIVDKFMEKPIQYLNSCGGRKMDEKLKDLNFLVGILEESCFEKSR